MSAGVYERTTTSRPPDANLGSVRARRPDTVLEIRRLHRGGGSVASIAEQFGVSTRTVYRYLRDEAFFEVDVAGWVATFAKRPRHAPVRVSAWRRP